MAEKHLRLTLCAMKAQELVNLMERNDVKRAMGRTVSPMERQAERELAKEVRRMVAVSEHKFRTFIFGEKGDEDEVRPHQYLRENEQELRRIGVPVESIVSEGEILDVAVRVPSQEALAG